MMPFLILILAGFIIGSCGTLIGAGGGFLLVSLLIISTHHSMPPNIITAVSIAVVAANAISGSVAYAAAGRIDYKAGLTFGLFTIPGSVAGVLMIKYVPLHLFNILFGILLTGLATYLFINSGKPAVAKPILANMPASARHRFLTNSKGEQFSYTYNQ